MNSFFKPHIKMLTEEGFKVDIACNYTDLPLDSLYSELGCAFHQIDFSRSPLSTSNIKAYKQLKSVIENGNYDIVHCHTPNASVITRLVCRKLRNKSGLKVLYTAHGFHFFKGAPLKNWIFYYPVEKICSYFTDVLITINNEDYTLAQKKLKAKQTKYVHGVGIDLSRFENVEVDRAAKRRELGVPEDAILLLSVGELNENKNHQIVISGLKKINNPKLHYVIAGIGEKRQDLLELANNFELDDRVHLIGYRDDMAEIYKVSDIFVFPSYREGLSVALMEAMACGLPVVCSKIRGNIDLIDENGGVFFDADGVESFNAAIHKIVSADLNAMGANNIISINKYSLENVLLEMKIIYGSEG